MRKATILAAAVVLAAGTMAQAQPWFLTGSFPNVNWSEPGSNAALELKDDGVSPDAAAGDGIYTLSVADTVLGTTPGDGYEYKIGEGGWGTTVPVNNGKVIAPQAGQNLVFFLKDTEFGDGLRPEVGIGEGTNGVAWADTTEAATDAASAISVVGAFQSELGGTDWDAGSTTSTITLTEAGAGTASDKLYGATVTNLPAGVYDYKIVLNNSFSPIDFGNRGAGGDNHNFTVITTSDVVTFTFDGVTGRANAENPTAQAGPPWYAFSDVWGETFDATTELDNVAGGVYYRTFTVPTAGDHWVRIRQGIGASFPDSNRYPFTTTAANQDVLVIFDTNSYADGYTPATNIVVVLDDATRAPLNSFEAVQPVGDWQSEFGAASDWNNDVSAMRAKDDGVGVDTTAGDGIYSISLTNLTATSFSANGKAVAVRTGNTTDQGDRWNIQLGGNGEGLTEDGDNDATPFAVVASQPHVFKIDTAMGRFGVGVNGIADPTRPVYFVPGQISETNAKSWNLYE